MHLGLVHLQSHLCEFSCRSSLLKLYVTEILRGILVKILRLRGRVTYLETPVPIASNCKVIPGYGVTHCLCRSQGISNSSHSCSGKNVFQQNKNASHWRVWLATMHMQIETADKGLRGHPWRRTTRQWACTGRKEIFFVYLPLMVCTSYNKTSWEVPDSWSFMLLCKCANLQFTLRKTHLSHSQFKIVPFK